MLATETTSPVEVVFPREGVFVLESRHCKGFRMDPMAHDFWKILLVFRGTGTLFQGARRHPLAPGDVAVVPPGITHWLEDSGTAPLSLYGLCLQKGFLDRLPCPVGLSGNLVLHRHPIWAAEVAGLVRSLLIEQTRPSPGASAWITGLAWQIIGIVWRARQARQRMPGQQARSLARERVAAYATELSRSFHKETEIDEVAATLGLSRRRFTQLFREITGESWLQTVRRFRLEHARRLLRETNRSIAAVAFEAGFSDLSHFYRQFRRDAHTSPEAWRKSVARKPRRP